MLDIEFKREKEVETLFRRLKNDKIKIIAGLRRSGKSYLLDPLFKNYLIKMGGYSDENFEIKDFSKQDEIASNESLKSYLEGLAKKKELRFIFLDEVQESGDRFAEIILKFHHMHPEYQIYITGSNSKILSDDIVNYFKDDGDPFFIESLPYVEIIAELPKFSLEDYFKVGGLPSVLVQESEAERLNELKMLSKNLYLTDIENRLKKSGVLNKFSPLEAESVIRTICSNITNPASVSRIVTSYLGKGRAIGSAERNAFSKDCLSILHEGENSFFLYRYIYPHNQIDERNPNAWENHQIKYYCYDIGLLKTVANSADLRGGILENAVFLELHRRGIEAKPYIEYGEDGNEIKNIDFSFEYGGNRVLLQVAFDINIGNEKREVTNLLKIDGPYDKYIVYVNNLLEKEGGLTYLTAEKFFKEFI